MPFVSDKQRRYLYSQKPEVAKKFAEHHAEGGRGGATSRALQKLWGWATEDSKKVPAMQIRNQQYANYMRARNAGETDAKFQDWLDQTGGGEVRTEGPSFVESARDVARVATPYGSVEDAYIAGQEAAAGNYGSALGHAGLAAAGFIPFVRPAARAVKAAPLAKGAVKGGFDPDYAKLFIDEVAGVKPRPAKSVGASANIGTDAPIYKFTKHDKAGEYTGRFGLPDTPEARKAVSDIAADATAIRAGKRVDDPNISVGKTKWWEAVKPGKDNVPNYKNPSIPLRNNPQDLVDYALPSRAKWKELYPNTPYPTKKAGVLTAEPRKINEYGKLNPNWAEGKVDPFGIVEGHYNVGKGKKVRDFMKSSVDPATSQGTAIASETLLDSEKQRRLAALRRAGIIK